MSKQSLALTGAALLVVTFLGIQALKIDPGPESSQGHITVGHANEGDVQVSCVLLIDTAAFPSLGIKEGGQLYGKALVFVNPKAIAQKPQVIKGLTVVGDCSATGGAGTAKDFQVEVWLANAPTPPAWDCACSSGADCSKVVNSLPRLALPPDTIDAPLGETMDPGLFSGAGCVPMPCVLSAADKTWPDACPLDTGKAAPDALAVPADLAPAKADAMAKPAAPTK